MHSSQSRTFTYFHTESSNKGYTKSRLELDAKLNTKAARALEEGCMYGIYVKINICLHINICKNNSYYSSQIVI